MELTDRHRKVSCRVCGKSMRNDNLLRHNKSHKDLLSLSEKEVKEELLARHAVELERKAKRQKIEEIAHQEGLPIPQEIAEVESNEEGEGLLEDLMKDHQRYLDKVELGKKIDSFLHQGIIGEESLTKERQHALTLYRKQRPTFDILNVQLRPWQEDAMKYFDAPSERQVIWIRGKNGDEGKTWFQRYVQSFYGYNRVVQLDLRIKHASICNVLKKRSLAQIDIFLFNDARSVSGEEINLYRILEDIKDGQATATKYDNDNIRFRTPNTVIVFSNCYPNLNKLSKDRWIVLHPNKDGLKNVTSQVMELRRKGYNVERINDVESWKNVEKKPYFNM